MSDSSHQPEWLREFPSESDLSTPSVAPRDARSVIDSLTQRLRAGGASGEPQQTGVAAESQALRRLRSAIRSPKMLFVAAAIFIAPALIVALRNWPTVSSAAADVGSTVASVMANLRPSTPPPVVDAVESEPQVAAPRRRTARVLPASPLPVASSAPEPIASRALSVEAASALVEPWAGRRLGDGESNAVAEANNQSVYSSADVDVEPPTLLSPDVPGLAIRGLPTRTQAIELLVRADGAVEYVKLRTTQERMLDAMLLSRAKMWRFEPAQRDGRPVPYRLLLMWDMPDR